MGIENDQQPRRPLRAGCAAGGVVRPGLIPPVPLEQARARSKSVADDALRAEVQALTEALRAVTAERDLLRTAAQRIDRCIETGDPDRGSREFTAALDQLIFALEVDPDELAASIARHPAGKART